jgi:hypothetical protein
MYASTLLSCRTSGRPPKREGARPPLFSTHRTEPAWLRPDGVSCSRAARIPGIDPRNRPSQHLVTGRGVAGITLMQRRPWESLITWTPSRALSRSTRTPLTIRRRPLP